MLEIERKYHIKNLNQVREELIELGALFIRSEKETDIYLNVANRDSMSTKECLRIRSGKEKTEITYKPPSTKENSSDTHFAKKETNLPISANTVDIATHLLMNLGCTVLVELFKERDYYTLSGATITLDLLNHKYYFIEIEVEMEDEKEALNIIDSLENKLGLTSDDIETRPYRDIAMGI